MVETEKLSIIIPVYNVENYLDKCLYNVVNQTYKNIEIIIVNDGSTDNSQFIIDKYSTDSRIISVIKENEGLSSARNEGMKYATGEYIGFIDSDDYPELNMYEKMMTLLLEDDSLDIAICSYYRCLEDKRQVDNYNYTKVMNREEVFCELAKSGLFEAHAWSKVYRRDLLNNIEYPVGKLYEDIFTTYKIIQKANKIVYINEQLYFYRINEYSITNHKFKKADMDLVDASVEFYDFLLKEGYFDAAKLQRDSLTRNAIAILRKMFDAGEFELLLYKKLQRIIKEGYPQYIFSHFKFTNKLFGFFVIISPRLLRRVYTRYK